MDFLEAFNLLVKLREACPQIRYHFENDVLIINTEFWCLDGTAKEFEMAAKMFEPA